MDENKKVDSEETKTVESQEENALVKNKHKELKAIIISAVSVVVVVALVVGVVGFNKGWFKKSVDTSVESAVAPTTSETSFLTKGFSSGVRIANIGEILVVADMESIYLINEKNGETDMIMHGCFQDIAFNGETVIFHKYESGKPTYADAGKIYKYDIKTQKVEFILDTNGCYGEILFFDNNYLYYTDNNGSEGCEEFVLLKYDFKNKTSETISDIDNNSYNQSTYDEGYIIFNSDGLKLYNASTKENDLKLYNVLTGEISLIDKDGASGFVKDGKVYYDVLNINSLSDKVMSCNIDGTDKELLTPDNSDNLVLTYNSTQIVCSDDNGNYTLFNFDTGKRIEFRIPNYEFFSDSHVFFDWVYFVNDKLVVYSLSQDYKTFTTYSLNDDGTLKKLKEAKTDFGENDLPNKLRILVTDNMIYTYGLGTGLDKSRCFKLEAVK